MDRFKVTSNFNVVNPEGKLVIDNTLMEGEMKLTDVLDREIENLENLLIKVRAARAALDV